MYQNTLTYFGRKSALISEDFFPFSAIRRKYQTISLVLQISNNPSCATNIKQSLLCYKYQTIPLVLQISTLDLVSFPNSYKLFLQLRPKKKLRLEKRVVA
jgi:hypothetical protein